MPKQYNYTKWHKGGRWCDNDEGYNTQYCAACNRKTEHEVDDCIPCGDLRAKR
jgi:hypothetical protein